MICAIWTDLSTMIIIYIGIEKGSFSHFIFEIVQMIIDIHIANIDISMVLHVYSNEAIFLK